ncbi:MAG: hypothetical protein KatS3mg036_0588 [Ignavibacterium sp.]|nr:MAG: hypothetical protein KatS3mg036_0588 [Ignavibacterium sp.]
MVSLAVKSHWKLALKSLKRAITVTIQELNQIRKSRKYHNKIIDDLRSQKKIFRIREDSI